ncbi:MAG: tetratricopeptide repeat protein, partial [Planctomycetota bacterium]
MPPRRTHADRRGAFALRAAAPAAAALLLACACGARAATWRSTWTAPGAAFQGAARESFEAARAALDAGRRSEALERLRRLQGEAPGNLEVGAWVQDLEALLLEAGVDVFAPRFTLSADPPDDVLRRAYGAGAADAPTAPSLVLAARAETDVIAALSALDRALELDPSSAWAHYGRAHVLLADRTRVDRWTVARTALERALELDPGHLRARRLEAWMAGQEGDRDGAERLLARWLDVVEDDARVARSDYVDALLDFAHHLLLRGETGRAVRILEDLEGEAHARPRRLMLLTVARQEAG